MPPLGSILMGEAISYSSSCHISSVTEYTKKLNVICEVDFPYYPDTCAYTHTHTHTHTLVVLKTEFPLERSCPPVMGQFQLLGLLLVGADQELSEQLALLAEVQVPDLLLLRTVGVDHV